MVDENLVVSPSPGCTRALEAAAWSVPVADLPTASVLRYDWGIAENKARRELCLPIRREGDRVCVAAAFPPGAADFCLELEAKTGLRATLAAALPQEIWDALNRATGRER